VFVYILCLLLLREDDGYDSVQQTFTGMFAHPIAIAPPDLAAQLRQLADHLNFLGEPNATLES
jgi:hypothetical protein